MSEWISVKDELPKVLSGSVIPMSEKVLVFTTDGKISLERMFYNALWTGGYYEIGEFVTHFMLLPDPPEVDDE